jgi:glycosyltransferase involved in cell wall biosynthesis
VHLVLINHYAGSPAHGMEFRPHQIARHWVAAGHDVTILAGSFSHLRNRNPEVTGRVAEEFIDGIRYRWLRTPEYQGNGLGRIRSIHAFIRAIDRERRTFLADRRVDAVIASSTYPFDIDPARRIARDHDATLVWEVHDLWPLSPIELAGYSPKHPFIRVTQRAEDRCCRDADLVVSILPRAIDHLRTRGLDPSRYVVVPNGVDLDEAAAPDPELVPLHAATAIDALREEGRFVIGYAGSHTTSYGLDTLLDAVRLAEDTRPAVVFIGDGPEKAQLEVMAADLPGVRFLDRMPRLDAISTLQACDAVFVGLRAEPLFRFGIGMNKIFDAMLVERPVLAAYSAGNDPIGEAGCGITVPAGDAKGLEIAMSQVAAMPPDERRRLGAAGGDFVRRHHDYRLLSSRFLDEIERHRVDSRGTPK